MTKTSDTRPIVALDVDGVLLDCDTSFAFVASFAFGRDVPRLNREYNLTKRYGLTQDETDHVFETMKSHPSGWGGMPVLSGAVEAALRLRELGYALHLVTAISEDLKDLRLECLAQAGLVPDGIHCAGHAYASKANILRELNPVMLVDDRLHHLYDAPFVEHRVWVDHGDHQDGLVVDESLYYTNSLAQWVRSWERTQPFGRQAA